MSSITIFRNMLIKIGTRGSKLALWQAYFVEKKLQQQGAETQIVIIETKGDKILDRSLSKIGSKGVFTQELEDQLRTHQIDIAVHSAKDLQSELDDDLELIAFSERELVNDVLVSYNKNLALIPTANFIIGTSSTRRVALLKHYFPHIQTTDMRGNLQTRLRKLEEGQCDALLLAYAGVHRMAYDDLIVAHIPTHQFTPAVGQGSVAIECSRTLDEAKKSLIREAINHNNTELCLLAERAFLKHLQGGCSVPVFGLATLQENKIVLSGGVVSLDGKTILKDEAEGNDPIVVGISLAENLKSQGAEAILKAIRG